MTNEEIARFVETRPAEAERAARIGERAWRDARVICASDAAAKAAARAAVELEIIACRGWHGVIGRQGLLG